MSLISTLEYIIITPTIVQYILEYIKYIITILASIMCV